MIKFNLTILVAKGIFSCKDRSVSITISISCFVIINLLIGKLTVLLSRSFLRKDTHRPLPISMNTLRLSLIFDAHSAQNGYRLGKHEKCQADSLFIA